MISLLGFEDEIDGAEQAEAGPGVVPGEGDLHVKKGEGGEHGEGDDLLEDF